MSVGDTLKKCNRLRGVDFEKVNIIEPSTGKYIDLEDDSSLFVNCLLLFQSEDLSYLAKTDQHNFRRKIETRHKNCHQCHASMWFRRSWHCRYVTFDLWPANRLFLTCSFLTFFLKRLRSSCLQTLQKIWCTGEMPPFTRSPAVFCLPLLPFPFKDASPRHFSLKFSFPIYVTEITCAKSSEIFLFLLLAQFNRE